MHKIIRSILTDEEWNAEAKQVGLGLTEIIALKVVRLGSDEINFKILKLIEMKTKECTKIEDIIRETGLTKVPVNVRINELEKVDLVKRWRGTGIVTLTALGRLFIEIVEKSEDLIKEYIINKLNL